jgi:lipoprotein-releasing system permease protein
LRFETFISLRYLLTRRRAGLLSMITLISVGGVAVGVTALIIVISVMDGFDRQLIQKMIGIISHLEVSSRKFDRTPGQIDNYLELARSLEEHEEVLAAAPVIRQQALVQADMGIEAEKVGVGVYGIVPEAERRVSELEEYCKLGRLPEAPREAIVGRILAQRLGVDLGDRIWAVTRLSRTAVGPMAKTAELKVVGIFESGWYDFDDKLVYVTLQTAQDIFLFEEDTDLCDMIRLKIKDPMRAREVGQSLGPYVEPRETYFRPGESPVRLSWQEQSPEFFQALAMEKLVMFIILLLIVIVASFNIIGILSMVVIEKTREIGVLRALGCGTRQIMLIFVFQGVFIGLAGTLLGIGLGLLGCYAVEHWITYKLPGAIYGFTKLPVLVNWPTIGIIFVSAMVICLLASVAPALKACRLKTVEALRYE